MNKVILILILTIFGVFLHTTFGKSQLRRTNFLSLNKNKQKALEFLIKKVLKNYKKHEPRLVVPDSKLSSSDFDETNEDDGSHSEGNLEHLNSDSKKRKKFKVYLIRINKKRNANLRSRVKKMKKILRNLDYYDANLNTKMYLRSTFPPRPNKARIYSDEKVPFKTTRRPPKYNSEKYTTHVQEILTTPADENGESADVTDNVKDFIKEDTKEDIKESVKDNFDGPPNEEEIFHTAIAEVVDDDTYTTTGIAEDVKDYVKEDILNDIKDNVNEPPEEAELILQTPEVASDNAYTTTGNINDVKEYVPEYISLKEDIPIQESVKENFYGPAKEEEIVQTAIPEVKYDDNDDAYTTTAINTDPNIGPEGRSNPKIEPEVYLEQGIEKISRLLKYGLDKSGDAIADKRKRDDAESDNEQFVEHSKYKYDEDNTNIESINKLNKISRQSNKDKGESDGFDFEMQTEYVDWSDKNKRDPKKKKKYSKKHDKIESDKEDENVGKKTNIDSLDLKGNTDNKKGLNISNKQTTTISPIRQTAMILEVDKKIYMSSKAESEETRHKKILKNENNSNDLRSPKHSDDENDETLTIDHQGLLSKVLRSRPSKYDYYRESPENGHVFRSKEDPNQNYFNDYPKL